MDVFLSFNPQNIALTFCSDDDGKTWRYLNDIYRFFWPSADYFGMRVEFVDEIEVIIRI